MLFKDSEALAYHLLAEFGRSPNRIEQDGWHQSHKELFDKEASSFTVL